MPSDLPELFSELPLSPAVLGAIEAASYTTPTKVQAGVIPLVLAGIDLIIQSQTGTGKTAAFAIPVAEMLDNDPGTVQALVLAPTRELAMQVAAEFARMGCEARGLSVVAVYGGASINEQMRALKTAEVIVATPGRMLDLLRRKATHLDKLRVFILDEADEMLSMGFEKELRAISEFIPEDRQSLLFSATVDERIKGIASNMLSFPEFLTFSSDHVAAKEVDHYYYMISGVGRLRDLHRVIMLDEPENALIFCNTRDDSFHVANYLKRSGYNSEVLNGDLPQKEREKVLKGMRDKEVQFLVATDIAARGIDISFLPCVINYVLPESAESYIHRTGRTGRAGRAGEAISLISPREIGMFYQLRRAYKFDLKARVMPNDEDLVALKERRALDGLLHGLDANEDLAYGAYLGFADGFSEIPDSRARLAKLLAYFVEGEAAKRRSEAIAEVAATIAAPGTSEVEPVRDLPARVEPSRTEPRSAEPRPRQPSRERHETAPAPQPESANSDFEDRGRPYNDGNQASAEGSPDGDEEPRRRTRRSRRGRRRQGEYAGDDQARQPRSGSPDGNGRDQRSGRGAQDDRDGGRSQRDHRRQETPASAPRMTEIRVNVGAEVVDTAASLVALLVELSGMDDEDMGAARLKPDHAFVEVREDLADDIIAAIDRAQVDGHLLRASR